MWESAHSGEHHLPDMGQGLCRSETCELNARSWWNSFLSALGCEMRDDPVLRHCHLDLSEITDCNLGQETEQVLFVQGILAE